MNGSLHFHFYLETSPKTELAYVMRKIWQWVTKTLKQSKLKLLGYQAVLVQCSSMITNTNLYQNMFAEVS